jgi:hypothetical protein
VEKRNIYFDEEQHKYTDNLGNPYTSVTTLISKYYEGFKAIEIAEACEHIGKNPKHPKYLKYKGKTVKQLLYEWEKNKDDACEKGTKKHNYFELAVRESTNYRKIKSNFQNNRIYTIDDIINDDTIGRIDIDFFEKKGIKENYPQIFNIIKELTDKGFLIYAEIGVYDSVNMICGLIDIILIRNKEFIILDWKTNSMPIRYEAGYFEKDDYGQITDNFINKDSYFYTPLNNIPASTGHKYSMQLSGYANMVESFGFKHLGSILTHIRDIKFGLTTKEEVKLLNVLDLKNEFEIMKEHHHTLNKINKKESQTTLF